MKNKKSFDWYSQSQRFSLRKYHFGLASVFLGTALIFGNGVATKADELASSGGGESPTDQNTEALPEETTYDNIEIVESQALSTGVENTVDTSGNTGLETPETVVGEVTPAA